MKWVLVNSALTVAFVVLVVPSLLSQQPRQRDSTPFERPKRLTVVASTSNAETITKLQGVLTDAGFAITSVDRDNGELAASKRDSQTSQGSDRVLIWLERDPAAPAEKAFIYLLYARFEPFVGSREGPVRVVMYDEERARMTALQDKVIAFAGSR